MIDKEKPVALKPCRSPYCECTVGQCTHPGCYDARHEAFTPPADEQEEIARAEEAIDVLKQALAAPWNVWFRVAAIQNKEKNT